MPPKCFSLLHKRRSCRIAKSYTKSAGSESSIALTKEIEFNFFIRLDYLYETWHTSFIMLMATKGASDSFLFVPRIGALENAPESFNSRKKRTG